MGFWETVISEAVVILLCLLCGSKARLTSTSDSYISRGNITSLTDLKLTEKDVYENRFTVTWAPVDQSWNASEVSSFLLTILIQDSNKNIVFTITDINTNAYTIEEVNPGTKYTINLSAIRHHGSALLSNTLIIIPGTNLGKPPITFGKLLILSFVMLLWVLAIAHFLRTWRKKMTLRPTYDMTSSSGVTSSYDVINPCHATHSYTHIQAQRPNSFTPDLSHQASGSSLQCKTRESTSRSITDLQAIIPEDYTTDTLSSLDQPSSSKITYCRS